MIILANFFNIQAQEYPNTIPIISQKYPNGSNLECYIDERYERHCVQETQHVFLEGLKITTNNGTEEERERKEDK